MNAVFYNMLNAVRSIRQLYYDAENKIALKYGLSKGESSVLAFLHNNPGRDTLSDIAYGRHMKKANVSAAIKMLEEKSFIGRKLDCNDRRVTHLFLLERSSGFIEELSAASDVLSEQLLKDFKADDISKLDDFMARLGNNARRGL